jgi:hypothetical protein
MVSMSTLGMTPDQVMQSFRTSVIDAWSFRVNGRTLSYQEYLTLPEYMRSNDEDAGAEHFARYVLQWLGFTEKDDWNDNRPRSERKTDTPDFLVNASTGRAFLWENKSTATDLKEEHLQHIRRYSSDTAGYAVWCNMRRIVAIYFLSGDRLTYNILADISVEGLYGEQKIYKENLALFRLLFCKERFTKFTELTDRIAVPEEIFQKNSLPLVTQEAKDSFIDRSQQSLAHLKLAALTQVRKYITREDALDDKEKTCRHEWARELKKPEGSRAFDTMRKPVVEDRASSLTFSSGTISTKDIERVTDGIASGTVTPSSNAAFDIWRERAGKVFQGIGFQVSQASRIIEAYRIWLERQNEQKENSPEIFAEQVAYVFLIRLLLVRVLEDKEILKPRLASNGGFGNWRSYIRTCFRECAGVDQHACAILAQEAGRYSLHFFQQPIFDWFLPDDFLVVETLEFLCRYNFQKVASDIIGFTYEEYIQKTARKSTGHFLTRDAVVEYMLDLLGYEGIHVLGRRILDPACGSGGFLVHAASRYRRALIHSLCKKYEVDEKGLSAHLEYRRELAQRYVDDLTGLFFGMEINPFACYLAEMNMLIQALDDLFVLQQSGEMHPVERFQIYSTDSLDLPDEIVENSGVLDALWAPHVRDHPLDESYLIKAKLENYAQGFFFIVSNPPYVNAARVRLGREYGAFPFFSQILSGITNTYLLFLRLGTHYLSSGGRMICIVPLTILGDASAANARRILTTSPFKTTKVVRFFTGNILFPGVDQAVAIVQIEKDSMAEAKAQAPAWQVEMSGGYTIDEAVKSKTFQISSNVFHGTPASPAWHSAWLVSNDTGSYNVWEHIKRNTSSSLGFLWRDHLEMRKGDVASDHLHPFRLGRNHKPVPGDIAVQKSEDIFRYAPLSRVPSDWVRPKGMETMSRGRDISVNTALLRILNLDASEQGITLRKIARLNTRETFIATWFQRDRHHPFLFPDEQWRFRLLPEGDVKVAQGLLAFLNSKVVAYLLNLFSTNNNISQGELARVLIPDPESFPAAQLAELTENLLRERAYIEDECILTYGAEFSEADVDFVYIPPSRVVSASHHLQKLTFDRWSMQGIIVNKGSTSGRIRALSKRGRLEYHGDDPSHSAVLHLFLDELSKQDLLWSDAQAWQLPDPVVASVWLRMYHDMCQSAQMRWKRFITLQKQVDDVVMDWYGFDDNMRKAIGKGLDWAHRRRVGELFNEENTKISG